MTRCAHELDLLGDSLIDPYVEWREESSAVWLAYERWHDASRPDRAAAFVAYNAALDREERASNTYAALIRQATPPPRTRPDRSCRPQWIEPPWS